jgi:signal transduction histidine kinase
VFGRIRPDVLLRDSVLTLLRSLDVAVYDADAGMSPLYVSTAHEASPRFRSTLPIKIGGRAWRLSAGSKTSEEGLLPPEAQRVLATGILLSLLLFALMRAQARARDTSDRHAAELQAADRAKDEFLAVLSHELRTPLNVLLGWLAMLRSGAVREERRAHALDVIERNAREQAQLIEDLLDVSRILMGKIRLDTQVIDLVPAVAATIDALRPSAESRDVTLRGPDSPPNQNLFIAADAARFQQILTNLLWNALKFTPPGGSVWVNVAVVDATARVSVCDTGVGIAPELLPRVFERFWQADSSTTRTYNGIGMGLAIVRDLVQLHGGSVDAHSAGRNQGSTFVVTLPLIPHEPGTEASLILAPASPHLN